MLASCCFTGGISPGTHSLWCPPAPPVLHQAGTLVWYGLWVQSPHAKQGCPPFPPPQGRVLSLLPQ